LEVEDRSQGYPRRYEIGVDYITSGEHRTLAAAYREIQDLKFPVPVKADAVDRQEAVPEDESVVAAADETAIGGGALDEATKLAAEPRSPAPAAPSSRGRNDGAVTP